MAIEVARFFGLTDEKASKTIKQISAVVLDWKKIATRYKKANAEQQDHRILPKGALTTTCRLFGKSKHSPWTGLIKVLV
ncbi:MAG: hypothetical protein IPI18_01165 [Saprospiraceae bacterium]|nr:hypothetical protein [Saprospiraceae bacterium]